MEHQHIRKVVIRSDDTIELVSESDQVVSLNILAEYRGTDVNRRTYIVSTQDGEPVQSEGDTIQGADGQPLDVSVNQ